MEKFKGEIYHSSDLAGNETKGNDIIIIGGGASAVETLEFASEEDSEKTYILARSDKWIIPRNSPVGILLFFNVFEGETPFSWIPELLLNKFFYRYLKDLAPSDRAFSPVLPWLTLMLCTRFGLARLNSLEGVSRALRRKEWNSMSGPRESLQVDLAESVSSK
jgi:hypothetical protein